jgi:hypothetical protein
MIHYFCTCKVYFYNVICVHEEENEEDGMLQFENFKATYSKIGDVVGIRFIYINYVIINHAHKLKIRYLGIEISPINFYNLQVSSLWTSFH